MKIGLFNYSDNLGGAARASYRIHKSLINQGIKSNLYVSKKSIPDISIQESPNKFDRYFSNLRPQLVSKFIKLMNPKINSYSSISILPSNWPKFINSSDIDVVHLNWINAEMMSIEDIAKISKPIVWTLHDMWPFLGSKHLSKKTDLIELTKIKKISFFKNLFNIDNWTYNRKKKSWTKPIQIVTPSKWLENCVIESELMKDWPVTTIPHPIDTDFWKPYSDKHFRSRFNINNNKKILIYGADGGIESKNKGFDLLLKSLEKMEDYFNDFVLCVFGEDKPIKLKTNFPIINLGRITNDKKLRQIYCASDLCIVPSRQESFCQVALEAQSCGTPVLAFSIGGLIDIVDHKNTGYLANPFDTELFSHYIKSFIKNKNVDHLRINARKRVEKLYSMSTVAKKYINIYKKIS